jgi:hypothetical protein
MASAYWYITAGHPQCSPICRRARFFFRLLRLASRSGHADGSSSSEARERFFSLSGANHLLQNKLLSVQQQTICFKTNFPPPGSKPSASEQTSQRPAANHLLQSKLLAAREQTICLATNFSATGSKPSALAAQIFAPREEPPSNARTCLQARTKREKK